ncbi:MAG: GIY-YIG nuclease family protein [Gammaproteobacteria bacterium]|nr:GIY-YIG nuclease family protein [Gammaproteobacteria bacterium]
MVANKLLELLNSGAVEKGPVEGFVYIGEYRDIETGEPLFDQVKIGYTTKTLEERATALSGGVIGPLKFTMIYAWRFQPAGYAYMTEQRLHGLFDDYRQMGEFFSGMEGLIEEWAGEAIDKLFGDISEPVLIDGEQV